VNSTINVVRTGNFALQLKCCLNFKQKLKAEVLCTFIWQNKWNALKTVQDHQRENKSHRATIYNKTASIIQKS